MDPNQYDLPFSGQNPEPKTDPAMSAPVSAEQPQPSPIPAEQPQAAPAPEEIPNPFAVPAPESTYSRTGGEFARETPFAPNPGAFSPWGAPAAPENTPAPGEYGTSSYASPTPPPVPPKKKRHTGLIVFLCILLFAVGLAFGYGAYRFIQNVTDDRDPGSHSEPRGDEKENEDIDEPFVPGTFAPTYGDDEKVFSAAEIYKNSVNGVVGISTEVMGENVFGQQTPYAVSGSGFVFSADGYILTNCHIVEDATSISVTMYNGTEYDARLIGKDSQNDVAVLKIEPTEELTVLPIGKSADMLVGEEIAVIGNPLGELTYTLTCGVVSNLSREITTDESTVPIRMFQTDAAINNGNSGGPAINCFGNVIGIVSAKCASSTIEGLGFCIPIDDAMEIAQDLIEFGHVQGRPFLGIEGQAVSGYSGGTYITGVRVVNVQSGSCADKAGIHRGDIITEFDGTDIATFAELQSALSKFKAGDTVELTVYRDRENVFITAVLDEAK